MSSEEDEVDVDVAWTAQRLEEERTRIEDCLRRVYNDVGRTENRDLTTYAERVRTGLGLQEVAYNYRLRIKIESDGSGVGCVCGEVTPNDVTSVPMVKSGTISDRPRSLTHTTALANPRALLEVPIEVCCVRENYAEVVCAFCFYHVSMIKDPDMQTCARCKGVWYCSQECKTNDASMHDMLECGVMRRLPTLRQARFERMDRIILPDHYTVFRMTVRLFTQRMLHPLWFGEFYSNTISNARLLSQHDWDSYVALSLKMAHVLPMDVLLSLLTPDAVEVSKGMRQVDIVAVMSKIQMNSFGIGSEVLSPGSVLPDLKSTGSAISTLASMPNHSCRPSSDWQFVFERHYRPMIQFTYKADRLNGRKSPAPNSPITISYIADVEELDYLTRRTKLIRDHLFFCNCERCQEDEVAAKRVAAESQRRAPAVKQEFV